MGWTSYFTVNPTKSEMDKYYNWEDEGQKVEVLKSAMVGSVYYAAVRVTDKRTLDTVVTAAVVKTKRRNGELSYKAMDETMGPCEANCPGSILKLLTPTDSQYANDWRRKCEANAKRPKLSDLPVGTRIRLRNGDVLICQAPAFQFKRNWWCIEGKFNYVSKKYIVDFEII